MDSDTWNSYHIISNRARAICYSVRQTEFRMKTEMTVNNLASATLENVHVLKNLAVSFFATLNYILYQVKLHGLKIVFD